MNDSSRPGQNEAGEEDDHTYLRQSVEQIVRREAMHTLAAEKLRCDQTVDGQRLTDDTDDQHLLNFMPQLKRLCAQIVADDAPPVEATWVRWAQCPGYRLTPLGKQVFRACRFFAQRQNEGRDWEHAYTDYQFHPVVAVLFGAVTRWWALIGGWGGPNEAMLECVEDSERVAALRQFVEHIRSVCRSQAFQNLLHDHERKANDNFRSACDLAAKVFKHHSRPLVLRIDLFFRPSAKKWGTSEEADAALTKYLRALRTRRVVPGYIAFIIKRENGVSRGVHYHLMVFLDGHLHRNAYYLTKMMGDKWVKRVGAANGSYFNCYARKHRYLFNGLGLVHYSGAEKLIGIRIALWYMSKQDSVLKVDDSKVKNFWRSWKLAGDPTCGAPRKSINDMVLVTRLLGGRRSKYPPGLEPHRTNERGQQR